jgi:hypothetical protein
MSISKCLVFYSNTGKGNEEKRVPPFENRKGQATLVGFGCAIHPKGAAPEIRAVISDEGGIKLQVDFGYEQTALIAVSQVVRD